MNDAPRKIGKTRPHPGLFIRPLRAVEIGCRLNATSIVAAQALDGIGVWRTGVQPQPAVIVFQIREYADTK